MINTDMLGPALAVFAVLLVLGGAAFVGLLWWAFG